MLLRNTVYQVHKVYQVRQVCCGSLPLTGNLRIFDNIGWVERSETHRFIGVGVGIGVERS
jgi:hypothetical protein